MTEGSEAGTCANCGEPIVEGRLNCAKCGAVYPGYEERPLERNPDDQGGTE